jgi:hypothetical protein
MAQCAVLLGLLICASPIQAQSVQQSGTVTPGHIASWATNGVLVDGGIPGGPIFTGSTTVNDFACAGASGTIIDCGLSAVGTNAWTGLQNFNGGATAPTRSPGDNTTNIANTAFVTAAITVGNITIGTTPIAGGTPKGLLYDNAGFVGNLATGNSSILATDSSGNPSIGTALPNGITAATQTSSDNTTKVATTSFVQSALAVAPITVGTTVVASGGSTSTTYGFLYNKNGILGDTTQNLPEPLAIAAPGLPGGKSVLSLNQSGYILPAFVNAENPSIVLSGDQGPASQGETILFFDTFGANANATISFSKSGGGSINTGSVSGNTLTVTAQSYGSIAINQIAIASGLPSAMTITANAGSGGSPCNGVACTGNGGTGTYALSGSATVGSGTVLTNDAPTSPTATQAGQLIGIISTSGWYGSAPATRSFGTANIQFYTEGNFTSTSWPTGIRFFTTPVGGNSEVIRLVIGASGTVTETLNSIGTVQTDGIVLTNNTAASVGAQQYSPALHFSGSGWETNTSASQTVDWSLQGIAIQGAANPTGSLFFNSQINGAGYISQARLTSGGIFNVTTGFQIGGAAASGNVLRGNGTNFVSATLAAADLSNGTTGSGAVVLATSPSITTPAITTSATVTNNAIGGGQADGAILTNTTAAANGAQQSSPSLHLIGQGWETNTSASQTVDWIATNLPIQGAASPTTALVLSSQVNGGGYITQARLTSGGVLNVTTGLQIAGAAASGNTLRGNGTNFVSAALASTDLSDVTDAGSWTPSDQSGASLTFTSVSVSYTKIGNMVFVYGRFAFPSTASGASVSIGGLPLTVANQNYASSPGVCNSNGTISVQAQPAKNTTTFFLLNAVTGAAVTNANMSTITLNCTFSYSTT